MRVLDFKLNLWEMRCEMTKQVEKKNMKLLNAFYSNGVAIYGKAFPENTSEQIGKLSSAMKNFGTKSIIIKQDFKGIKKGVKC